MPRGKPKFTFDDIKPGSADSGNPDETGGTADSNSSASGAATTIDPASVAGGNIGNGGNGGDDGGTVKRKRGRPPGSGNANRAAKTPADINGIEKLLFGIHMAMAHIIAPEFGMPQEECSELAKAINDVNRHYGFKILDQKTADWFHLIQCVAVMYGGRIMVIRERRKMERAAKPTPFRPRAVEPAGAQMHQPTPDKVVPPGFEAPDENATRMSNIPGVAAVQFPPNHPLFTDGVKQ